MKILEDVTFVWFDFQDPVFVTFFVFLLLIIVLIVYFCISFTFKQRKHSAYSQEVINDSNMMRCFTINIKDGVVTYFDRIDLKHKYKVDLAGFYGFFHINDVEKIKTWLTDLTMNKKDVAPFIEVDVIGDKHSKQNVFSLLKHVSTSENNNIIHLEMQTLRYLSLNNEDDFARKNTNTRNVTLSTLTEKVNANKSLKGYTYSLRFTYVNELAFKESEEERVMLFKLKNVVYQYGKDKKNSRYLCDISNREIILTDLKIDTKQDAYTLATSIYSDVKKVMQLNDYEKYFRFNIGICKNSYFYKDFNSILKACQEASISSFNETKPITLFTKNISSVLPVEKYKETISALISEDKIRYLFRPIVDVKNKKVLGYLESIKTYDSSLTSYNELMRYAHSCQKDRELFATVAKNVIPRFADENPKPKTPLFYPASILDFENIENILPQITRIEKVHLVLIFEENEISQSSSHLKELINSLQTLKLLGYELALSMMDKNLLLDVNFYKIFDYFIVGTSMTGEIKKNNLTRLSLRTLIEALLKFKKPIIATGLEGWQSVEIMVKSGVNYVSSEVISPSSEMVLPVEKKKFEKLAIFLK